MYIEIVFNIPVNRSFTYEADENLGCRIGVRVSVPFGRRKLTGYVIEVHARKPEGFEAKSVERVIDKEPVFGLHQIELASWMSSLYFCSQGEALALMIPGGRREIELPSLGIGEIPVRKKLSLSKHQKDAVSEILTGGHDLYYLFGVTGSGKTEVFLQAAEKIIEQDRSVIYLVPEISLTHQLVRIVTERFTDNVAVLHSAMTPSQRLKEWRKIMNDKVRLIIGARSAVFAPCKDIGLIIIDEEHEHTYKSGSTPRYHARQIAFKRTAASSGTVVLGSATPSLECWHLMEQGRIHRLNLPDRVSGGSMPAVRIIDMKRSSEVLSEPLKKEMKAVLDRKKQIILVLNRRGCSYFFHCRSCGYQMICRHCSVALTYHKKKEKMVCHYCGYTQRPIKVCPECGSLDVGYSGFGTELVEQAVRSHFPFARIDRLDADTTKKQKHLGTVLKNFHDGEIDILLGTQMVAKGLNFPLLELVGIVLADSGLHLPDFRAQERTFSLLLQVAGRAGRFSNTGSVLIQTYYPENSAILMASEGDVEQFCKEEIQTRAVLGFPPITRMVRFVFRARSARKAEEDAGRAADLLDEVLHTHRLSADILGPAEAPILRIANNTRWQILVKSSDFHQLHRAAALFVNRFSPAAGVYME
ncbi:MAG: primosomal protein N', partial [Spirochaetales bacterium]|nr:primosomal protein N' [Spirochaetales bacterium]